MVYGIRRSALAIGVSVAVLLIGLVSGPVAQAQPLERINIAVLDLELDGNVNASYQITLSNRLRQELLNTGRFAVIERGRMQDILSEQGLQLSGCTSDECVVEAGRLLGVEEMVAGSVGLVGSTYSVILRRIDVQSGEILDARNVDCPCPIEEVMTSSLKKAATLIAGLQFEEPDVKGPAGVFPRSLILSGWGQRAAGRPAMGWTLTLAQLGTLGFLGYSGMDYSGKLSEYNDAKAAYDNNTDPTLAIELYDARIEADMAAADAYDMFNMAIGAAAGVYVLNILDGIVFGRGTPPEGGNGNWMNQGHSFQVGWVRGERGRVVPAVSLSISLDSGRR